MDKSISVYSVGFKIYNKIFYSHYISDNVVDTEILFREVNSDKNIIIQNIVYRMDIDTSDSSYCTVCSEYIVQCEDRFLQLQSIINVNCADYSDNFNFIREILKEHRLSGNNVDPWDIQLVRITTI